ncbi:MAG: sulfite exporter TauE/SafE family protein [Xanthomonadales bacterium]|nr:sulfite exporter TauE/SafE family protein [Xanthomonadales bacterium]
MALDWNIILIVTALGVFGSLIGSRIAGRVNQHKLRKVFGLFLIVMGIYILVRTLPSVWPF